MSVAGPIAQLSDRRISDVASPTRPDPSRLMGVIACAVGADAALAARLAPATREEDTIEIRGHLAVVSAPGLLTVRDLHILADRIGAVLEPGVALGLAAGPSSEDEAATDLLVGRALVALAHGERLGAGSVMFDDELAAEQERRDHLARDLAAAVDAGRFIPHYQPIIDLAGGDINGIEVLARWQDPVRQLVRPAGFLDVAVEAGLLGPIGDQVLDRALAQIATWARDSGTTWPVRVNVHPCQLVGGRFASRIAALLARHEVAPRWLELELNLGGGARPSGGLVDLGPGPAGELDQLHRSGVSFAIELGADGAHRAGWGELDERVTTVKLHRSLLDRCLEEPSFARQVAVMTSQLGTRGARVVAQGIETAAHHRAATDLGVRLGQGFWIQRPAAADRLAGVIARGVRIEPLG